MLEPPPCANYSHPPPQPLAKYLSLDMDEQSCSGRGQASGMYKMKDIEAKHLMLVLRNHKPTLQHWVEPSKLSDQW